MVGAELVGDAVGAVADAGKVDEHGVFAEGEEPGVIVPIGRFRIAEAAMLVEDVADEIIQPIGQEVIPCVVQLAALLDGQDAVEVIVFPPAGIGRIERAVLPLALFPDLLHVRGERGVCGDFDGVVPRLRVPSHHPVIIARVVELPPEIIAEGLFGVQGHAAVLDAGTAVEGIGHVGGDGDAVGLQVVGIRLLLPEEVERVVVGGVPVVEALHHPLRQAGDLRNADALTVPCEDNTLLRGGEVVHGRAVRDGEGGMGEAVVGIIRQAGAVEQLSEIHKAAPMYHAAAGV